MLRNTLLFLLTALVASCTHLEGGEGQGGSDTGTTIGGVSTDLSTSAAELAEEAPEESQHRDPVVYRGTDRQVNMPGKEEPIRFIGDAVSLNFEQAPLDEVMHAIMGDILQLDYIVDQPVQGKVTLRTRTPMPRDELLNVLESLLKANDVIMIRGDDGRYLVTSTRRGVRLSPSVSNPGDTAAGYSTIIIPLQYISATNMAEILRPMADESAFVRIDDSRNLLMMAGTRLQLDGWLDIIATFDVDQLKGMSVGLFPLENSSVEEVTVALDAMLHEGGQGAAGLGNMIRVIPVRRLNSILIVTPRAHYLDSVQQWIERLDEAHYSEYDQRLYVYPVQNTTAARLADLINSIYSGGGSQRRRDSDSGQGFGGNAGVAPGMTPETIGGGKSGGASSSFGSNRSSGSGSSISAAGSLSGIGPGSTVEDVRVVADDENNALMIYATAMQFRIIESALEQLDVVATQVIIEASILEVTLTDELQYGLEWTFKNGLGSDYDGLGQLVNAGTEPSTIVPGFSYTVTNSIGDISAVLNALSEESLLNIISTPSVMVLDNHTAYIHVGQQVPIIDQQSTSDASDTSRITQSVTYRDTGVKLNVRPSVNAGGLVTMDVEQSVTDVGEIDVATRQRAFLERNIMSRVAVRSGESVVLGGLIRENASTGSQGLPFLHKIPVVGGLFGTVSDTSTRTELLVIITPRAIYDESELRAVSDEMRSQIRNLELLEAPPL